VRHTKKLYFYLSYESLSFTQKFFFVCIRILPQNALVAWKAFESHYTIVNISLAWMRSEYLLATRSGESVYTYLDISGLDLHCTLQLFKLTDNGCNCGAKKGAFPCTLAAFMQ